MDATLAGCVILDDRGRVLLIHRNTMKRVQWETIGGKVETGEKPASAAQREAVEEAGVDVAIEQELGNCEFTEDGRVMRYVWFLAIIESGAPVIRESRTHDSLQYFSWEELKNMPDQLSQNVRKLVDAYFHEKIKLHST